MNIAFPAFFLLALVLTGFIFLNAFERRENTNLEKIPFSSASARALVSSGIIHLILLSIVHQFILPVDFSVSIKLITGAKLTDSDISGLQVDVVNIVFYFLSTYIVAYILGKFLQIAVLKFSPYKSSKFAFDTPWYYELKGKLSEEADAEIIKISCLVNSGECAYLYYGYLQDFYLDDSGQLDRLVLSDVYRRNIQDDEDLPIGKIAGDQQDQRFYQIKGDRLVLKYDKVVNLNIEYLYMYETPFEEGKTEEV